MSSLRLVLEQTMRTSSIIILLVIDFALVGCSLTGKAIYLEPAEQANWNLKNHDNDIFHPPVPVVAEHKCDKINILFSGALAGQTIYSAGPMLVPVVPMFGILDILSGEHGMKLFLSIEGSTEDPGLDKSNISISVGQKQINADEFGGHLYGDRWMYYYTFKSSLLFVEKITVVTNKTIQNCSIPSILYEKKGYPVIFLFWLPGQLHHRPWLE